MNAHESHAPRDAQSIADEILHVDRIVVIEGADLYGPKFPKKAEALPEKGWKSLTKTELQSEMTEKDLIFFANKMVPKTRNTVVEIAPDGLEFINTPAYKKILAVARTRREQATKRPIKSRRIASPLRSLSQPVDKNSKESFRIIT